MAWNHPYHSVMISRRTYSCRPRRSVSRVRLHSPRPPRRRPQQRPPGTGTANRPHCPPAPSPQPRGACSRARTTAAARCARGCSTAAKPALGNCRQARGSTIVTDAAACPDVKISAKLSALVQSGNAPVDALARRADVLNQPQIASTAALARAFPEPPTRKREPHHGHRQTAACRFHGLIGRRLLKLNSRMAGARRADLSKGRKWSDGDPYADALTSGRRLSLQDLSADPAPTCRSMAIRHVEKVDDSRWRQFPEPIRCRGLLAGFTPSARLPGGRGGGGGGGNVRVRTRHALPDAFHHKYVSAHSWIRPQGRWLATGRAAPVQEQLPTNSTVHPDPVAHVSPNNTPTGPGAQPYYWQSIPNGTSAVPRQISLNCRKPGARQPRGDGRRNRPPTRHLISKCPCS